MTRKLSAREKDLAARSTAIDAAINALDMEWPAARREELSMNEQGRAMVWIFEQDHKALVGAKAIIDAMLVDADGFGTLFTLAARDMKAFKAIVVLAQVEMERQPEAVAA